MAKAFILKAGEDKQAAISKATENGRASSLAGGLNLPEGTHRFTVAEKDAFGLLEVRSTADGKLWVLPIVAGSMKLNGRTETFVISDAPGAKTLVVPDNFYVNMALNASYAITIGNRKGRKVVIAVEEVEADNVISEELVQKPTKAKKLAF